jgi:hypothetical protein
MNDEKPTLGDHRNSPGVNHSCNQLCWVVAAGGSFWANFVRTESEVSRRVLEVLYHCKYKVLDRPVAMVL